MDGMLDVVIPQVQYYARASWLTGLSPGQLGVTKNEHYTVPADAPSFVRDLRDQYGYYTTLVEHIGHLIQEVLITR